MLFLKTVFLTFALEGGLIPGHELSLYIFPDNQEVIQLSRTYYTDFQAKIEFWEYFNLSGGITGFSLQNGNGVSGYPFRIDFRTGITFKYKSVEIGYMHDCFHPINPNVIILPYGKIDAGNDRIFIHAEIRKGLFQ